jgi:hypothetical protein
MNYFNFIFNRNIKRVHERGYAEDRPPEKIAQLVPIPTKKDRILKLAQTCSQTDSRASFPGKDRSLVHKPKQVLRQSFAKNSFESGKAGNSLQGQSKQDPNKRKTLEERKKKARDLAARDVPILKEDPRKLESSQDNNTQSNEPTLSQSTKKGFDDKTMGILYFILRSKYCFLWIYHRCCKGRSYDRKPSN